MARILAAGVYMAEKPNTVAHVSLCLALSKKHRVEQRWIALSPNGKGACDHPMTLAVVTERTPKFQLLDRLLVDAQDYDWILLCDDDIELDFDAIDKLIDYATAYDFALCQPARTTDSFTDHPLVQVLPGLKARRTRFVEIGPFVCMRRDAAKLLLPFGNACGMGWGLDFVWPHIIEDANLKMGIIDAVPVAHRIRPPVTGYNYESARREMDRLLAEHPHLTLDQAFTVIEAYL